MRIFLDTNIIIEYLCARQQKDLVERIFESADDKEHEYHISLGSFYTLTYLLEDHLKRNGIHRPDLTEKLRQVLTGLLAIFRVSSITESQLMKGVTDLRFDDLEDSYQFQVAKQHHCNLFVTINTKDFRKTDTDDLPIITPQQFINPYLSNINISR